MTPPQPTWQENKGARWFIIPQIHTEPIVLLTLYLTIVDEIGASSFFRISHWNLRKNTLNYQRKFYVRVSSNNPPFPDQLFNCHHTTAFSKQLVPNPLLNARLRRLPQSMICVPNCRTSLTVGLVHKFRVIVHHWCDPINAICRRYPMWMNGNCIQPF
jgi:hypothetical protein